MWVIAAVALAHPAFWLKKACSRFENISILSNKTVGRIFTLHSALFQAWVWQIGSSLLGGLISHTHISTCFDTGQGLVHIQADESSIPPLGYT